MILRSTVQMSYTKFTFVEMEFVTVVTLSIALKALLNPNE